MKNRFSVITLMSTLFMSLFCGEVRAEEMNDPLSKSRAVFSGLAGSHVGGEIDTLMPFHATDSNLLFGSAKGFKYGGQYKTLELGLGGRHIIDNSIIGINAFAGQQVSPNKISYNRGVLGVEWLRGEHELRLNSYLFWGNLKHNLIDKGVQSGAVVGNNIVFNHNYAIEEMPTNGTDVEFGHRFHPDWKYLLGFFNYNNGVFGPQGSLEYTINLKTTVGLVAQYDQVQGTLAYLKLSYWFGASTLKSNVSDISSRMLELVRHNNFVPAKEVSSYTEQDIYQNNIYFASAEGKPQATGGLGDPTTMQHISTLSKPGDIIIAQNDGAIDTGNFTLQHDQLLQNRSVNLIVNGFNVLPANTTQSATMKGSLTTLGAATISGINFQNYSINSASNSLTTNAINITGADTVNLTNVNISGYSGTGVNITGNSTINLTNVTSNQNGTGLSATAGTVNILGNANQFNHNSAGSGISITDKAILNQAQNVQANNNSGHGIYLAGNNGTTLLKNITANQNGINGYTIASNNLTVLAENLTGNANQQAGLSLQSGILNVAGESNIFSNNINNGFIVGTNGSLEALSDTLINANGSDGLVLNGAGDISLIFITSTNNVGNGITINNDAANVTIENINSSNNTAGSGVWLNAGTLQDNDSTTNVFDYNKNWGILVGASDGITQTNAHLLSLKNADLSHNGADGLLLNSNTLTDMVLFSNVSANFNNGISAIANTGNGIFITQGGTLIFDEVTTSHNVLSGMRVDNMNAGVTVNNITSSSNSNYGLRILKGTVTINGNSNVINENAYSGVYSESPQNNNLVINQLTLSNNNTSSGVFDGISLRNAGTVFINDTSIKGSAGNGISVIGGGIVSGNNVTIDGNNLVTDGIIAIDNAHVNITNLAIFGVPNGDFNNAVEVKNNAEITIINPTKLVGYISNTDNSDAKVTVTDGAQNYIAGGTPYPAFLYCDIPDGNVPQCQ